MRMSCNGCRVLRKGCGESCTIRPCLEWIKTAESQANATVFLAKFYGRAGLMNLINAAPHNLRPAVFRSLLYEACGRIVNPTYGSVGLLWSGDWHICQAAVECILKGCPIHPIGPPISMIPSGNLPVPGSSPRSALLESIARELRRVKSRSRFKPEKRRSPREEPQVCNLRGRRCYPSGELASREPVTNLVSTHSQRRCAVGNTPVEEIDCRGSTWTAADDVAPATGVESDDVEVELELRLGSPGSSDHEKFMSAQCHWPPVAASCLDLALTPPC